MNSITESTVRSSLRVSVVICAYTEERYGDLMEAIASVRSQSVPAYETVVVCDHNESLLERVRRDAPDVVAVAERRAAGPLGRAEQRHRRGERRRDRVPRRRRLRGRRLARAPRRALRRPARARRRRPGRAALARRPPALGVPRGVRLGRRLHLPRHAARPRAGPQHDRRQHVAAPRASSTPSARSRPASVASARSRSAARRRSSASARAAASRRPRSSTSPAPASAIA